jgi:hypothetical protein
MSYILEALKKSELERERLDRSAGADEALVSVEVTAAQGASSANLASRSLMLTYLLVVAVLVSLLVYLLLKPAEKVSLLSPNLVVNETLVQPPLNSESVEAGVDVSEVPMTAVSTVEVAIAKVGVAHVLDTNAVEINRRDRVLIQPKNTDSKVTEETSIIKKVSKKEVGEKKISEKENTKKLKLADEKSANEVSKVLSIEQAEESLLDRIPNISITSHIYSSQAKRRSIVVNDERLVEGDFVAAKVQVKEITHQGMILNVNGSLLAVSRSRGWNR